MLTVPTKQVIEAFEAEGYSAHLDDQFGYTPLHLVVMNDDISILFEGKGVSQEEINFDRLSDVAVMVTLDGVRSDNVEEDTLLFAESFDEIIKISKEILSS